MTIEDNANRQSNILSHQAQSLALPRLNLWRRLVVKVLTHIKIGHLRVEFCEGTAMEFGTPTPELQPVTVMMHSDKPFRRLALGGHLALAESYMDGQWSCSSLKALFDLFLANTKMLEGINQKGQLNIWLSRLRHLANANTRKGSKRNIAYHYDLGNDFYEEWLDPSMTYSSAYKLSQDEPLEDAQYRKYKRVLELAGAVKGESLLEIGCGWGGMAEAAARQGINSHGITLSKEQLAYAKKRSVDKGFSNLAEFELRDYRDTEGKYDHIVSIEMIEAVGEENWNSYFNIIRERLKDDGSAVIQGIVIDEDRYENYRNRVDFIQKYIFPGGMLPSPSALKKSIEAAGLQLVHEEYFGLDYAATLGRWDEAFSRAWTDLQAQGFDERFRRMWHYYLAYCQAGFEAKSIDVGFFKIQKA
ncbi:class I SAM-dependent methyltransferase [Rhodobacteraceae bacterium RKSG542]|uniref:SAM-dependent methyltransferase n=1 Tax=Pseudovibrio flavus TaxID=2529854 RepID=UPI0012BBB379|nr:cyclopropane-fatty-acyl-phospholipid synthase family protein [Pseudovibrio flavus]MTI16292.1 class I SAM-dependent methyltransferase [Pseudovibrio flavus]